MHIWIGACNQTFELTGNVPQRKVISTPFGKEGKQKGNAISNALQAKENTNVYSLASGWSPEVLVGWKSQLYKQVASQKVTPWVAPALNIKVCLHRVLIWDFLCIYRGFRLYFQHFLPCALEKKKRFQKDIVFIRFLCLFYPNTFLRSSLSSRLLLLSNPSQTCKCQKSSKKRGTSCLCNWPQGCLIYSVSSISQYAYQSKRAGIPFDTESPRASFSMH